MFEKTSDAMSFLHQHGIFFVTEKDVDIEIYAKTIDYLENANLQLGFKLPNLPYVPRLGASYTGGNSVIEPISLRDHISAGSKKLIPLNSKCQNIQLVLNFEGKTIHYVAENLDHIILDENGHVDQGKMSKKPSGRKEKTSTKSKDIRTYYQILETSKSNYIKRLCVFVSLSVTLITQAY